ncbi:RNA-guided endonuclease TnpB family protein [Pseudonocardia asaccharolytica]
MPSAGPARRRRCSPTGVARRQGRRARSNRRRKARARVANLHRRVRRQRCDHAHKTADWLAAHHDVICHEALRITNMSRSARGTLDQPGSRVAQKAGLNRSILDAGWGVFLSILTAKAESAGRELIAADPRNTSRTCPSCGHCAADNRVAQAEFRCLRCGLDTHADLVGAVNVLRAGLARRDAAAAAWREATASRRWRSHGCMHTRHPGAPNARPGRAGLVCYGNVIDVTSARAPASLAWIALGVVYVLWGSTYLANRYIILTVPPLTAGAYRFLVGGLLLGIVVFAVAGTRAFRMTAAQFGTTALSGLLLPAWGNGLVVIGQQHVASGLTALLIASVPLHIVVLRALTGDRPRRATVGGVAVGVVGLAVLVLSGPSEGAGGVFGNAWWGPWVVLLAALGWATGTFATTRLPVPPNPFALAAVQMLTGGVIMLVAGAAAGERLDLAAVTAESWWAWAYMAVVVSLGAFGAYAYALAQLPVSTVATYAYVNPVIAVVLGVVIAGERFSAMHLLGGAVVLLAVVLVILAERRAPDRRGALAASRS